jgi:hypothetical protein
VHRDELVAGTFRPAEAFGHEGDEAGIPDAVFDLDELAADLDDAADDQIPARFRYEFVGRHVAAKISPALPPIFRCRVAGGATCF